MFCLMFFFSIVHPLSRLSQCLWERKNYRIFSLKATKHPHYTILSAYRIQYKVDITMKYLRSDRLATEKSDTNTSQSLVSINCSVQVMKRTLGILARQGCILFLVIFRLRLVFKKKPYILVSWPQDRCLCFWCLLIIIFFPHRTKIMTCIFV